jgi:hypothetical protein
MVGHAQRSADRREIVDRQRQRPVKIKDPAAPGKNWMVTFHVHMIAFLGEDQNKFFNVA